MKSIITTICILSVFAFAQAQPVLLKELPLEAQNFISSNGKLYYTSGDSLWKSDGTPSGTLFVKKINETEIALTGMTIGTSFFFTTKESSGKRALWKSDGTAANTVKIAAYNNATPLIVYGGALYLAINNGISGKELWKTTGGIPTIVKDINPGSGDGVIGNIIISSGQLFFQAKTASGGTNIWKSNGTTAGTLLAADPAFDNYGNLTDVNGTIYFSRNIPTAIDQGGWTSYGSIAELWKTNGTTSGTSVVKRFAKNENEEYPEYEEYISSFHSANGKLYFNYYLNYGNSLPYDFLYESNGTEEGTREITGLAMDGRVEFITQAKGKIIYQGNGQGFPGAVTAYDPVSATEFSLKPSDDAYTSESVSKYTQAGNNFFFVDAIDAYMGSSGEDFQQLWQTDLTPGNAKAVKTLFKGTDFTGTDNLTAANDKLFFTTYSNYYYANPAAKKRRLWYYDPTKPVAPVAYFTLVNADTDEEIQVLEMGDQVNKPANVNISIKYHEIGKPASVVFKLADTIRRVENTAPYLIAGDNNGNYSPWPEARTGVHKVTATPYSLAGGKGTAGTATMVEFYLKVLSNAPVADAGPDREIQLPKDSVIIYGKATDDGTINSRYWNQLSGPTWDMGTIDHKMMASNMVAGVYVFRYSVNDNDGQHAYDDVTVTVKPAATGPAVVAFYLINAATDQRIREVTENDTLDLAHLPSQLNIQVVTNPEVVGSVRIQYHTRNGVESAAPYSLFGDTNGNYNSGNLQLGTNVLIATPYSQKSGGGTAGTSLRRQFFVKRSASTRLASTDQNTDMEVNAYPNPSQGIFTFTVLNSGEGMAAGEIYTAEGSQVAKVFERNALDGERVEFHWDPTGMKPGVYYIRFQSGNTVKMKRIVFKG